MSAGLALPSYEGPRGELVVVEQADDHHHHHRHHHDDDDDLNKLQFSCTQTHTGEGRRGDALITGIIRGAEKKNMVTARSVAQHA